MQTSAAQDLIRVRAVPVMVTLAIVMFVTACSATRSVFPTIDGDWNPLRHIEAAGDVCTGPRRLQSRIVGKPYQVSGRWYHPAEDPDYAEVGTAAWYGPKFHGRRAASGERFDMNALTAAHPTLPMPSKVSVRNLGNGRSVILRINDRGPFTRGRIIDVSRAAARELGFEEQGLAQVEVVYIGPAPLRQITTCR